MILTSCREPVGESSSPLIESQELVKKKVIMKTGRAGESVINRNMVVEVMKWQIEAFPGKEKMQLQALEKERS